MSLGASAGFDDAVASAVADGADASLTGAEGSATASGWLGAAGTTGFGAAGLGVEGAFATGAGAAAAGLFGNASRALRTTGASKVEDGPFTYSPSSLSLVMRSLLGMPSSFAIS